MTATTTGFACSRRVVSSAAIRSSARSTSRAVKTHFAARRTACAAATASADSAFEPELRAVAERRDERARFAPFGRGMQSLPVELAAPVQSRQSQLGRGIHIALQRLEHRRYFLGCVAEQHEIAPGFES